MQRSMFNVQVPVADGNEVFLMNTFSDAQILVSSDVCKRPALVAYGGTGYAHVLRQFVPRLEAKGFGKDQIRTLLVDNPRRFLAG